MNSTEVPSQWQIRVFRFQVPASGLNRSLRHAVTTDALHQIEHRRRIFNLAAHHHGREKFFQGRPCGFRPLIGIERAFAAGAFAPAFCAILTENAHEDDPTRGGPTKTRFKKMN